MILIIILLALLIEHYAELPGNIRQLDWVSGYVAALRSRCNRYSF